MKKPSCENESVQLRVGSVRDVVLHVVTVTAPNATSRETQPNVPSTIVFECQHTDQVCHLSMHSRSGSLSRSCRFARQLRSDSGGQWLFFVHINLFLLGTITLPVLPIVLSGIPSPAPEHPFCFALLRFTIPFFGKTKKPFALINAQIRSIAKIRLN